MEGLVIKIKEWVFWLGIPLLVILSSTLITACSGGDGGNNRARISGNIDRVCDHCPLETNLLASALGNSSSSYQPSLYLETQLALDFFTEYTTGNLIDPNSSTFWGGGYYGSSSGPVYAEGIFYVELIPNSTCYIPPGDYSVTTEIPGNVDPYSQLIRNLVLRVEGGDELFFLEVDYLSILNAMPHKVSCGGETFPSEMVGSITAIDSYGRRCVLGMGASTSNQNVVCHGY